MRYLSGAPHQNVMHWEHGGLMFTPEMGNQLDLDGVTWAADNGCYTAGDKFSPARWLAFLERWRGHGHCLFAVLPDVPFDHQATVARSLPYVDVVQALGYVPALAIQEGATVDNIPWESGIGALFIAGGKPKPTPTPLWSDIALATAKATRAFKTSPGIWDICRSGKRRGFHLHSARNNAKGAMQAAYDMGCDTIDGTFLKYAPDINWQRLQRWFAEFCPHGEARPAWDDDTRFWRCVTCGRDVWKLEA